VGLVLDRSIPTKGRVSKSTDKESRYTSTSAFVGSADKARSCCRVEKNGRKIAYLVDSLQRHDVYVLEVVPVRGKKEVA
jgi:hypothetical protein